MKEIELTQGQITLVDDEDFEWLSQWKWQATWSDFTKCFRATRKNEFKKTTDMARIILSCPEDKLVDHKDHNGLNNCRSNIRICTSTENNRNRRKLDGCTSKYKGVTWRKDRDKWKAQIKVRNIFNETIKLNIGHYENEEEAALAYDQIAREEFGEFAVLNF